jgi:hypothetical protein
MYTDSQAKAVAGVVVVVVFVVVVVVVVIVVVVVVLVVLVVVVMDPLLSIVISRPRLETGPAVAR